MKDRQFLILFLSFIVFFGSCDFSVSSSGEENQDSLFYVNDPAHLYFKNMRAYYYQQTTPAGTRMDLYTLRKLNLDNRQPVVYPMIVDNWMQDEAYLFLKTNEYTGGFAQPLTIVKAIENQRDTLILSNPGSKGQYILAMEIFKGLELGAQFEVQSASGDFMPLLKNRTDRSHYRTIVQDYLRMLE